MELSMKKGLILATLLMGLPAIAQEGTALKASAVAVCASCTGSLQAPPGPIIWFTILLGVRS